MPVRTTTYRISPHNWPRDFKLRLCVLSDFHACEPWMTPKRIAKICAKANGLGADIILLLGDYCSDMVWVTRRVRPADWARPIGTLKAPLGVHAVLGNHDWWDDPASQTDGGSLPESHRALEAVGVQVYSNRAVRLQHRGRPFWIAGVEDQMAHLGKGEHWRKAIGKDDLPGTLEQITDAAPVILMAHEPDIFPAVPDRVSLTLSGHTHGGQVRLFGRAPIVPSRYGERYAYGHIVEEGRHLVVSSGLGYSMMPIRFAASPEINLIELE